MTLEGPKWLAMGSQWAHFTCLGTCPPHHEDPNLHAQHHPHSPRSISEAPPPPKKTPAFGGPWWRGVLPPSTRFSPPWQDQVSRPLTVGRPHFRGSPSGCAGASGEPTRYQIPDTTNPPSPLPEAPPPLGGGLPPTVGGGSSWRSNPRSHSPPPLSCCAAFRVPIPTNPLSRHQLDLGPPTTKRVRVGIGGR